MYIKLNINFLINHFNRLIAISESQLLFSLFKLLKFLLMTAIYVLAKLRKQCLQNATKKQQPQFSVANFSKVHGPVCQIPRQIFHI